MPAPPPESEPAMVSIAGVLPPLCTGKGDIVVVTMMKVTPEERFLSVLANFTISDQRCRTSARGDGFTHISAVNGEPGHAIATSRGNNPCPHTNLYFTSI